MKHYKIFIADKNPCTLKTASIKRKHSTFAIFQQKNKNFFTKFSLRKNIA